MAESEMTMTVREIVEHEDGSATVTFDFDAKTMQALLQHAINDILLKAAKEKM